MDHAADGSSRDDALGPPLCRLHDDSAVAPLPPNAPGPPSLSMYVRHASKLLGWWRPSSESANMQPTKA
jgi:hypothetical protein